jgi:hypothetical protein
MTKIADFLAAGVEVRIWIGNWGWIWKTGFDCQFFFSFLFLLGYHSFG